jgi:hypothetical protein
MANLANLTFEEKREIAKAYNPPPEKSNAQKVVQRLLWFVGPVTAKLCVLAK